MKKLPKLSVVVRSIPLFALSAFLISSFSFAAQLPMTGALSGARVLRSSIGMLLHPTMVDSSSTQDPSPELQALIKKIVDTGDIFSTDDAEFRSIKQVPADVSVPHHAQYLSVVGIGTGTHDGPFTAFFLSSVDEDWARNADGNWVITQWIATSSLNGTLMDVYRGTLTEQPDGRVLDDKGIPTSASDAKEIAAWNDRLNYWLKSGN